MACAFALTSVVNRMVRAFRNYGCVISSVWSAVMGPS
jgi:hypothetical protein